MSYENMSYLLQHPTHSLFENDADEVVVMLGFRPCLNADIASKKVWTRTPTQAKKCGPEHPYKQAYTTSRVAAATKKLAHKSAITLE